jgi:hypothetical protein
MALSQRSQTAAHCSILRSSSTGTAAFGPEIDDSCPGKGHVIARLLIMFRKGSTPRASPAGPIQQRGSGRGA